MSSSETANLHLLRTSETDVLLNQYKLEVSCAAIAVIAIFAIGWNVVSTVSIVAWLVCAIIVYWLRWLLVQRYFQQPIDGRQPRNWLTVFAISMALTGLLWGFAGVAMAFQPSMTKLLLLAFCIACLATAIVAIYSGTYNLTLTFALPALLPAIFYLVTEHDGNFKQAGFMLGVYALMLIFFSNRVQSLFHTCLDEWDQNLQLVTQLEASNKQVEKLQMGLKSNISKNEQSQRKVQRLNSDLESYRGKMSHLSTTLESVSPHCPETGLINRHKFDETLDNEWRRVQRDYRPISLLIIRIDNLEKYQQRYDAQTCARFLKHLAETIKRFGQRAGEATARYDADKFALILPATTAKEAFEIAEAIKTKISHIKVLFPETEGQQPISASIGVATTIPVPSSSSKSLVEHAENARFEAGIQGGNLVIAYHAPSNFELVHWDPQLDGKFTESELRQKLSTLGYHTSREIFDSNRPLPETNTKEERAVGVVSGQLSVTVEGQQVLLKQGSCLVIPPGPKCSFEVAGQEPVVSLLVNE